MPQEVCLSQPQSRGILGGLPVPASVTGNPWRFACPSLLGGLPVPASVTGNPWRFACPSLSHGESLEVLKMLHSFIQVLSEQVCREMSPLSLPTNGSPSGSTKIKCEVGLIMCNRKSHCFPSFHRVTVTPPTDSNMLDILANFV